MIQFVALKYIVS